MAFLILSNYTNTCHSCVTLGKYLHFSRSQITHLHQEGAGLSDPQSLEQLQHSKILVAELRKTHGFL